MIILKKISSAIVLIFSASLAFSQVGINTTTPAAQLDVRSGNQAAPSNTDGMLIPKVDVFPAANPTTAQQGMLVYLTTAAGSKVPGFYYWDNVTTSWIGVGTKPGWETTGNTGTAPTANFVGTADNQPLAFRTNNTERLRIGNTGNIGLGTTTPQSKFHLFKNSSGMTPNPASIFTLEDNSFMYMSLLSSGESGILFGANGNSTDGGIIYNATGLHNGMILRTNNNQNRFVISSDGSIGIGDFVPQYPLQFESVLGDKICLWAGVGTQYGLGIQGHLLQIHTDVGSSDVAFGYGSSAAFNETMRIRGNGTVGIGITNPLAKLHVFNGASGMMPISGSGIALESNTSNYIDLLSTADTGVLFGANGNSGGGGILYNVGSYTNGLIFRTNNIIQMGISSAGNVTIGNGIADARLQINASNAATPANTDGILIPRVASFPLTNPTASQNGMMVFLTTSVGSSPAGFYYWDNSAVSWFGVGTKNNWSTTGNSGMNPATYYLGTTDNNDVSMRANGSEALRLKTSGNVLADNYTQLGSSAPAVKMLKLTGTTASSQGASVTVAHGLTTAKILDISVLVEYTPGSIMTAGYNVNSGYEFSYYVNGGSVIVINNAGNSASILSKPFRVLITYEQ